MDSLALCLISGFVEQCKHILLVSLHARLVEWIDTKHIATDAAGYLKEIDELSDVILVELWHGDVNIGHAAIHMSQLGTQFCHLVHFIHTLASEEFRPSRFSSSLGKSRLFSGCATLITVS